MASSSSRSSKAETVYMHFEIERREARIPRDICAGNALPGERNTQGNIYHCDL